MGGDPNTSGGRTGSADRGVLRRLRAAGLPLRKDLGQHLLLDRSILAGIVDAASVGHEDVVLEVGTGAGSLTRPLCERASRVVSVEIDERMIEFARRELADLENLELVHGDILERKGRLSAPVVDLLAAAERLKVVANLPYNIAGPFSIELFSALPSCSLAVLLVQKEMAERFTAGPETPAYGPPTLLLGYWAEVEVIRDLPPGSFRPPPKVTSTLIRARRRGCSLAAPELYPGFARWVKRLFRQRRKQLGGVLRRILGPDQSLKALQSIGVAPEARVAEVRADGFVALARDFPGIED